MRDEATYAHAVELYDRIVGLYPRIEAAKVYRGKAQPVLKVLRPVGGPVPMVDCGQVFLGLTRKAINTHAAIRVLTDAGHGEDALALARVLLENTILIEWLLRDPVFRPELYVTSGQLLKRHLATIVQDHYAHRPEVIEMAKRSLKSREVTAIAKLFGDTEQRWARKRNPDGTISKGRFGVEQMFHEVAQPKGGSSIGAAKSFVGEVVYFQLSAFVHSTITSLYRTARLTANQQYYSVEIDPNDSRCEEGLRIANLLMLSALSHLNEYIGGELDKEVDDIHEAMKTRPDTEPTG